jgi:DNA-directed RNA polymerase subunit RPC12/RpoP
MARKKIVLQTNAPWLRTGLAQNGRYLMKHLLKTGKYDLVYYCTNHVMSNDPNLQRLPCKAYGAIPADQNILNQLNQDPNRARDVAYGSHFIDQIIKDEKPDIWWESDDLWSTNGYMEKPWFKHVNAVFHKTPDSIPILDVAYQQAKSTPYYYTWAQFAVKEMRRVDPSLTHIKSIYGMSDTEHFAPITRKERDDLRARFGIDKDTTIFNVTNRNQLRKCFIQIIEAFAAFKREYSFAKTKLHFHTSFAEKGSGWDIPKLAAFYGLKQEDILCTYVCKNCGNWHIAQYGGEDIDCRYCGGKKSMITTSTNHGVPDDEMKLMHGLSDAGLSIFDSGGQEYASVSSLLCGMPTAISAYSCGEDFMHLPFVSAIDWVPYYQPGTNFKKATPKLESIKAFMVKVYKLTDAERLVIKDASREWAVKTFSVDSIGKQWEGVFDAMPPKDWSSVTLEYKPKNVGYPMPTMTDNELWVKALYNNILLVEPDPDGLKYWLNALATNMKREQVYAYFISVGQSDNAKAAKPMDFEELFDKNGKKRILVVMKESGGDLFTLTACLKGLKELYPDHDLYVACDPAFNDILAGNEYIHRVLPYQPVMEAELAMMNHADVYHYPALATQKQLNYLLHTKSALDITYKTRTPQEIEEGYQQV